MKDDGRVILSARIDPVLREHARTEAKRAGLEFSRWVERVIQKAVAAESAKRAMQEAIKRGECLSCGCAPCMCDQQ